MNYTPRQYAEALYGALEGKPEPARKEILKRFSLLLTKNRASNLKNQILLQYEKVYLARHTMHKIDVESAKPMPESIKKELENIVGTKLLIAEKHVPELVAGLTLLLDDTVFIDASAKTKIDNLFRE